MKKKEDHTITEGILRGDHKILKEFYKKHLPQVTAYIVNNSGDESEARDIFQDALVIVFEKLKNDNLNINCALGTYVYAVCRNLWLNRLRKRNKTIHNATLNELHFLEEETIVEDLDNAEKRAVIQKYFIKLGESCKAILALFFKGYTTQEIAKRQNFTEGYTRKRKFVCQKKLIEMAEKDPIFKELKRSSKE